MAKYHPDTNPRALPAITKAKDVNKLPWGGNAWWDLPIMEHVGRFARNNSFPRKERKGAVERASYLMTGETGFFTKDYTFDDYLADKET